MDNFTRGKGLLENFLSRKRSIMANKLIPKRLRKGKILDIGCGTYPFFLKNTKFNYKYGLDKLTTNEKFIIRKFDIEKEKIPFKDNFFDVITLLAVIEHIKKEKLLSLIKDVRRTLKPNGRLIITTPSPLANYPLKIMSKLELVSYEEIEEHKDYYSRSKIYTLLKKAGYNSKKIKSGHFEFFLNVWVYATK
jgi:2-polyprenyl-3-methyl-5-hydroxy-6-metoxy-1,4-benzoquinol methylase